MKRPMGDEAFCRSFWLFQLVGETAVIREIRERHFAEEKKRSWGIGKSSLSVKNDVNYGVRYVR